LDLCKIKNFYFDKTGTLEAVESSFIPLNKESDFAIPYLNAISELAKHSIMRGLKISGESKPIKDLTEVPGEGLVATAQDETHILIGRSSFLTKMGVPVSSDSFYPYVAVNGVLVGQILVKSAYDLNSNYF